MLRLQALWDAVRGRTARSNLVASRIITEVV
jgi:hypothetical protein